MDSSVRVAERTWSGCRTYPVRPTAVEIEYPITTSRVCESMVIICQLLAGRRERAAEISPMMSLIFFL